MTIWEAVLYRQVEDQFDKPQRRTQERTGTRSMISGSVGHSSVSTGQQYSTFDRDLFPAQAFSPCVRTIFSSCPTRRV